MNGHNMSGLTGVVVEIEGDNELKALGFSKPAWHNREGLNEQ